MNTHSVQLRQRTMRKIYGIWFFRRVLPIMCGEILLFTGLIVGAQGYISFGRVMDNATGRMSGHPLPSIGRFWMEAFFNTELATLVFVAGLAVLGTFVARDVLRLSKKMRGNFLRLPRVS